MEHKHCEMGVKELIDELKATQKVLILLDTVPSVYKMYKNNMAEASLKDINCPKYQLYGSQPM